MADSDQSMLLAIENGYYRQAQQLLQKKLKKYPTKSYYHALNNLIQFKQGKEQEAIQESLKLKAKIPSDPKTLEILTEIFSSAGLPNEATQVYENAVKKYPTYDLINSWFEISLKRYDIRSVQKASMSLQRTRPSRTHSLWASFGYLLVCELPDSSDTEKSLYPKIALKLVEALKPLKTEQEVYLYSRLLIKSEQYSEAIEAIELFSKGKKFDLELQILLLSSLNKLESWDKLSIYSSQILFKDQLDDFDTWKYLIKSQVKLGVSEEDILKQLTTINSRNSTLAHVSYAEEIQLNEKFGKYMASYYDSFKHKLCCFNDLKYFCSLPSFNKTEFLNHLDKTTQEILENSQFTETELNILVNNQKFKSLLSPGKDFINENFQYYQKFKSILTKKVDTDYFAGNEFILMNVEKILNGELNEDSNLVENAYKCLIILEASAVKDKHEFRLKLWIMKLYSFLNCHSQTLINFKSLKIKMIQNDTLGYYLGTRLATLLPGQDAIQHMTDVQKFYLTAHEEIMQSLQRGFDNIALNKLRGIIDFGRRIDKSLYKMLNLLELLKAAKLYGNNQLISYTLEVLKQENLVDLNEDLFDNRDFTSQWKFGSNEFNDSISNNLQIGPIQKTEYVKMNVLREIILSETNDIRVKVLVSKLNKVISGKGNTQLTNSESWIFKLYLAVFKVFLVNPDNDADFNFLIKNFNLNIIKNKFFNNSSYLTWEVNHKIISILELIRNVIAYTNLHHLPKKYSPKVADFKKALRALADDLVEFKQEIGIAERKEFDKVEESIKKFFATNKDVGVEIGSNMVQQTLDKIKVSLKESSLIRARP